MRWTANPVFGGSTPSRRSKRRKMKRLEDMGFYTLEDYRAENLSMASPLWRCELILTPACNFKCPYCRSLRNEMKHQLTKEQAINTIKLWGSGRLKNIRFSGGEPTLWRDGNYKLADLISLTKKEGIKRIALSTNGSAPLHTYMDLCYAGVNDFSISLDACCSTDHTKMTGNGGYWHTITNNITVLSKLTYVTVGVVLTDENMPNLGNIIKFIDTLGVSDIRIIPAAQHGNRLQPEDIPEKLLSKYPILRYRINNMLQGKTIRSISSNDVNKCHLVKDDMVVGGNYHFPCIIFLREQGDPIGTIDNKQIATIRRERYNWFKQHNTHIDQICSKNCLDVCVDYNNKCEEYVR